MTGKCGEPICTTEASCKAAAQSLGLTLGGAGYGFAGGYGTKGLYAYSKGVYAGRAYFGTAGLSTQGTDLAPGQWDGSGYTGFAVCEARAAVAGVRFFAWTGEVYQPGFCKILKPAFSAAPDLTTYQGYGYKLWEAVTETAMTAPVSSYGTLRGQYRPVAPTRCRVLTPSESCTNGVIDNFESDTDCGGSQCTGIGKTCASGLQCSAASDCASGICSSDLLEVFGASCADPAANPNSTIGYFPSCYIETECAEKCLADSECKAFVLDTTLDTYQMCNTTATTSIAGFTTMIPSRTCVSCSDSVKNGDETAIDCGGDTCGRCNDGKDCRFPADCKSDQCEITAVGQTCTSCVNTIKDGVETGPDCGGSQCQKRCSNDVSCLVDGDCMTDKCDTNTFKCRDLTNSERAAILCYNSQTGNGETDVDW